MEDYIRKVVVQANESWNMRNKNVLKISDSHSPRLVQNVQFVKPTFTNSRSAFSNQNCFGETLFQQIKKYIIFTRKTKDRKNDWKLIHHSLGLRDERAKPHSVLLVPTKALHLIGHFGVVRLDGHFHRTDEIALIRRLWDLNGIQLLQFL